MMQKEQSKAIQHVLNKEEVAELCIYLKIVNFNDCCNFIINNSNRFFALYLNLSQKNRTNWDEAYNRNDFNSCKMPVWDHGEI